MDAEEVRYVVSELEHFNARITRIWQEGLVAKDAEVEHLMMKIALMGLQAQLAYVVDVLKLAADR